MSELLSTTQAAKALGQTKSFIDKTIELAGLQPKHSYAKGSGMVMLYELDTLATAVKERLAVMEQERQAAALAAQAQTPQAVSQLSLKAVEDGLEQVLVKVGDVNKTLVEIQNVAESSGEEVTLVAEQNRLTFKAVGDLAQAVSASFRELHQMMVTQCNLLSEMRVEMDQQRALDEKRRHEEINNLKLIFDKLSVLTQPIDSSVTLSPSTATTVEAPVQPPPPPAPVPAPPKPVPPPPSPKEAAAIIEVITARKPPVLVASRHVKTPAASAIVEALANVTTKTVAKANGPMMKVVICGLIGVQQEPIRREFGNAVELHMFEVGQANAKGFATKVANADAVIILTKVMNNQLTRTISPYKDKVIPVTGHTSAVKMELTKLLTTRALAAA